MAMLGQHLPHLAGRPRRGTPRRFGYATGVLLSALACTAGDRQPDRGGPETPRSTRVMARVDTLPSGVVHVTNLGVTDRGGAWRFVLERTVPLPAEGAPGWVARPSTWEVSPDGSFFVMERNPPGIHVFSPEGRYVRTIGRKGAGPGEFSDPSNFRMHHDTLAVADVIQGRLVLFDTTGRYLGGARSFPNAFPAMITRDGILHLTGGTFTNGPASLGRFPLASVRMRLNGTVLDTLFYPRKELPRMWTLVDGTRDLGAPIPFSPARAGVLTLDGLIVWGYRDRARFTVARSARDTVRIVDFPPIAAVPIPDTLRRRAFDEIVGHYRGWLPGVAKFDDVPRAYPMWEHVAVAPDGSTWLFSRRSETEWQLHIFDPEGVLIGVVAPPVPVVTPMARWIGNRIYQLAGLPDGTFRFQVWRFDRGGSTNADREAH